MQRPGGSVGRHADSWCVHRSVDGSVLRWPETATICHLISRRHHPRKRMIQHSKTIELPGGAGLDTRWRRDKAACFPPLLAPNKGREIGGGRATRQPGQVRKEAALTRSGSGRSSVSYLFF